MKDTDLGKMLVKYPWILSASILENLEKILDFFDEEKVLLEFRCLIPSSRNLMQRNRYLSVLTIFYWTLSRFQEAAPRKQSKAGHIFWVVQLVR